MAREVRSHLPSSYCRRPLPQHDQRQKRSGEGTMGGLLRVGGAGYGAKKLGGGCVSTVLIFIILYWLLGNVF
jgi:hypothetical protein